MYRCVYTIDPIDIVLFCNLKDSDMLQRYFNQTLETRA